MVPVNWKDLLCTSPGIRMEVCKVIFIDDHRITVQIAAACRTACMLKQ